MRILPLFIGIVTFFFCHVEAHAQFWRTLTNPMYNAHCKLNESQFNKAEIILKKRENTIDTANPIYWHSLTRLAEQKSQLDVSIEYARKSVSFIYKLKESTESYTEFQKIYILDAYYLDLYYRKLLFEKYNTQRSKTSPTSNSKLLGFYLSESQKLATTISLTNINRKITLPQITENLNSLNDTIEFERIIKSKNTDKVWHYLQGLGRSDTEINLLPIHLKSFYIQARDSFYSWNYDRVLQKNTELDYLNFAEQFPSAPQAANALKNADELAFSKCRIAHTAKEYNHYLQKYPYGKYKKQAKMLLRYLTVVPVPYARADGKYIFVDSLKMRPWIDSAYDFAYPFCLKQHKKWTSNAATLISGCALVMLKDEYDRNQWFYIEKDGTRYNDKQYDEIRQISNNYAIVTASNHYGLIDKMGRELLPPIFVKIHFDTLNSIGMVYNGEYWALFNQFGKRITKFEYDEVATNSEVSDAPIQLSRFGNNRILVRKSKSLLVLDFEGNPRFLGTFAHIEPFQNNIALAELPDKRQILIDTNGNSLSDTFQNISTWIAGEYYQGVKLRSKKSTYQVLRITENSQSVVSAFTSEIPIDIAWYWNKPHFITKHKGEWHIYNYLDSMVYQSKTGDLRTHAQTLIVKNTRKNPKLRNSPIVKQWFNPYSKSFSTETAEEIGVLQNERLVLYNNGRAQLFKSNETELPIFHEAHQTPSVPNIKEIFRVNREDLLMARTDSMESIIDLNGKMLMDFVSGTLEEYGSVHFLINKVNGQYLITEDNKTILGPFDEINEEGFEGYYLINKASRWFWVDMKNREFIEMDQ